MENPTVGRPGTTERTRRAILDAAVITYAQDQQAPLRDVARAAGVGRSTLHRYFPDRTALVQALLGDAARVTTHVLQEASLDQGAPAEAFERAVSALFSLAPRLHFLFNEVPMDGQWEGSGWEEAHIPLAYLFLRGQQEGVFDPELDVEWFMRMVWYAISAGWEAMHEESLAKHRAVALASRSLLYGVSGPGLGSGSGSGPQPAR